MAAHGRGVAGGRRVRSRGRISNSRSDGGALWPVVELPHDLRLAGCGGPGEVSGIHPGGCHSAGHHFHMDFADFPFVSAGPGVRPFGPAAAFLFPPPAAEQIHLPAAAVFLIAAARHFVLRERSVR